MNLKAALGCFLVITMNTVVSDIFIFGLDMVFKLSFVRHCKITAVHDIFILMFCLWVNCETQRFTDQKLSSSIFPCWLSVRPSGSVTSPLISTVWCFRPYKPYMMHVWWYLVVSGPCLMVSGGVWSMSGGVWSSSGDVNGYRLIWPDLMYMGRYIFQCL